MFTGCTTNANGDCSISFQANALNARYPISATGGTCVLQYVYNSFDDVFDTCNSNTLDRCIVLPLDPACNCFCCQNPRPSNLFLTDSVYGAVNLTWNAAQNLYTGTTVGHFAGACGCPAAATTISYKLGCGCLGGANSGTSYILSVCYTVYFHIETCGTGQQGHDCPGPLDPMNPAQTCGCGHCDPNPSISLFGCFTNAISNNTTFHCAKPLNIVFSVTVLPIQLCTNGRPCLWNGTLCPPPWIGSAAWTVTE